MLRQQISPEVPYITVEIDRSNGRILQWYGVNDKKPDEKKIEIELEKWKQTVKQRETESKEKQKTEKDSRHTVACIAG